jgi:hypothetical protein
VGNEQQQVINLMVRWTHVGSPVSVANKKQLRIKMCKAELISGFSRL